MNLQRITRAVCLGLIALPTWCQNPPGIAIQDLVSEAQAALADVQTILSSQKLPPLKQVKLSLQTITVPGAEPNSWVVPSGMTLAANQSGQLDLLLRVPSTPPPQMAPPLSRDLENAIVILANALKQTLKSKSSRQITTQDVTVDVTANFNGAQVQIAPVAAGSTSVHQVTLTFASQ